MFRAFQLPAKVNQFRTSGMSEIPMNLQQPCLIELSARNLGPCLFETKSILVLSSPLVFWALSSCFCGEDSSLAWACNFIGSGKLEMACSGNGVWWLCTLLLVMLGFPGMLCGFGWWTSGSSARCLLLAWSSGMSIPWTLPAGIGASAEDASGLTSGILAWAKIVRLTRAAVDLRRSPLNVSRSHGSHSSST